MQTSRTRRTSATERFHREARRKRLSPVTVVLGLIGAGLLFSVGVILFGGGPRLSNIRDRVDMLKQEAARLESAGDLKGAVDVYGKALALARPHPEFRGDVVHLRATIRDLESRIHLRAAARKELTAFLKKCEGAVPDTAAALREEGQKLLRKYEGSEGALLIDVRKQCALLGAMIPKAAPAPVVFRERVVSECGLSDRKTADFARAIRMWDGYLKALRKKEWEAQAVLYRGVVDRMARDAAHLVRRAIERRIEEKDPSAAEALRRKETPRFEGTAGMAALR